MKAYSRLILAVILVFVCLLASANAIVFLSLNSENNKLYMIEANRLFAAYEQEGLDASIDFSEYPSVKQVDFLAADSPAPAINEFLESSDTTVMKVITPPSGVAHYAKLTVALSEQTNTGFVLLIVNVVFLALFVFVLTTLLFVQKQIIQPFSDISHMPEELAKGHFEKPLKEQKGRYFGRFIWSLDMLRDSLKTQRERAHNLEKERKTFVLSLAHDIKTPLSAIRLYTKALKEGLYDTPQKQTETYLHIQEKTDQIEDYLSSIIKSSTEEFLDIDVINTSFYLDDLVRRLRDEYSDTFELLGIGFDVGEFDNTLLYGDEDKALEALENGVENALKYGDNRSIRLTFDREDSSQLITIINSGSSMPSKETTHVFESFWRGSNSSGKSGSGLGLAIVRKIMAKMEGDAYFALQDGEAKLTLLFRTSGG